MLAYLADEVADDAAIVGMHVWTVGIENADDPGEKQRRPLNQTI
jgi:hypothetical protein